ncbi:MAG: T9SS type A sorting domain-containing protein [Bacteroidota bacterium]
MKNSLALATLLLFALNGLAQIPVLNSLPGSQYVVYLDFDGEVVNNTNWSATTINATSSGLTSAQIIEVFRRVSEKYRPFDVNITTSLSVYNAAAINKRIQVVVTTTSSWYGSAGGVAFVGSFGWPAYSPAFVFPNQLTYNADYVATAAAHEIGHTLALNHHAPYDASCNRIGYYHPGQGTGQTSWGPIMGAPYYSNFVVWYKGPTTSPTCAQTNQDDLALITGYIPYRNDDHGNTASVATTMNIVSNAISDSGSIERNNDVDFFKFTLSQTSNLTLNVRPWSLDPQNNTAACLDARVELLNSAGALLIADESPSTLNASISVSNLAAGTYFVKVDGVGISNYNDYGGTGPNDYGSLGRFYLTGTITSLATGIKPSANFNISPTACQGSAITATNTSTNNPTSFLWTCNGSNPSTSILQNAIFTFNSPGTYSVKLKATNSFGSDSITKSITINANPSITGSANTTICSGTTTTLTAGGATTYVWSPTTGLNISTGTTVNAAPTASTTYTVVGTGSGGCTGSRTVAVTVNSAPTLTTSANASICSGTSTTMSASGATSYTWTPNTSINTSTGSSVTATPTSSTTYTVTGSGTNGCTSSKTITVTVNANPVLTGSANTTTCSGTTTTLTSGGATTYVWSPTTGLNISTGTTVNAAPTASTTYTVVGTGSGGCTGSRTVSVKLTSTCGVPTGITVQNITGTSAQITWSAQPCAITYRLQYRASGLISWTNISSISGATISITGLQSNTTYQYRLRSNCSTSTNSNYSAIQTFSTTSSLKTSNELNDEYETANIYPNPTSGILNINVSYDEAGMLQLELYNIYGQRVWQQFQWVESEGVFNFNISHLAPGVYMLMMRKEQETSSYKLIKQ